MKYLVHSAHPISIAVESVTAKGTKVSGTLPGLEIEMLPVDGEGKTMTLQITEENYAGADPKELFGEGNTVQVGFTLVSKAEPKPAPEPTA